MRADLPPIDSLRRLSEQLEPLRSKIFRREQIGFRRSVLDLGAGYGSISSELTRRAAGRVISLDNQLLPLLALPENFSAAPRVCADARALPFAKNSFDFVFSQCVLFWVNSQLAIAEISRILAPGGVFVAIEPDYCAMIEHPTNAGGSSIWQAVVSRHGGDPAYGRKLPGVLSAAGLKVAVEFVSQVQVMTNDQLCFLAELPMDKSEELAFNKLSARFEQENIDFATFVHLPFFFVTARKAQ